MKPRKDIITEEEYTRRMSPTSLSPQEDSPGILKQTLAPNLKWA